MAAAVVTRTPIVARRPSKQSAATYRRRRLVAAAVASGLLAAPWVAGGWLGDGPLSRTEPGSSAVTPRFEPVARRTHVVQPGDTLWTIARGAQPSGDIRPLVDRLAAAHPGPLQPGQRIVLPAHP